MKIKFFTTNNSQETNTRTHEIKVDPELPRQVLELMDLKRREGYTFTKEDEKNYAYLLNIVFPPSTRTPQEHELKIHPDLIRALLKMKNEGNQAVIAQDPQNVIEAYAEAKNIAIDSRNSGTIRFDAKGIEALMRQAAESEDFDPNHFLELLASVMPNDLETLVEESVSSTNPH